jgi:hypothetical protein
MASVLKIGYSWRAQVRQAGQKSVSETFATKAEAVAWGRKIEAEMDARRFTDARGLAHLTLKELIEWYEEEIGGTSPFGKNKAAVLRMWKRDQSDGNVVIVVDVDRCAGQGTMHAGEGAGRYASVGAVERIPGLASKTVEFITQGRQRAIGLGEVAGLAHKSSRAAALACQR